MRTKPWKCKTVGIIGYGHMGKLIHQLIRRFTATVAVKVFEKNAAPDGVTFFSFAQVVRCDVIVFAVPMDAFGDVLLQVVGSEHLRKLTILIDICTDKVKPAMLLATHARNPHISCHPMWGPQAYKNSGGDIRGFPIVFVANTLHMVSPRTFTNLCKYLADLGFKIATMTAYQHDERIAAEELYVTHLLAQTLKRAGLLGNASTVAPPSYRDVRRGVESVSEDTELFHQLWTRVPHCQSVFERFYAAITQIHEEREKRT